MKKLPKKSQEIVSRYEVHKQRCLKIEKSLGKVAAHHYHLRHKADPASETAKSEFENLIANN